MGEPNPRDVGVSVTINQLHSVDVILQSFFCDLKLMVAWRDADAATLADPDQAAKESGRNGAVAQRGRTRTDGGGVGAVGSLWVPKIFLLNGESQDVLPHSYISDANKGRPRTQIAYIGTVYTPCDLHDFPFDSQRLQLHFRSKANRKRGVRDFVDFEVLGAGARRRVTLSSRSRMHEWEMRAVTVAFERTDPASSAKGESYAALAVQVDVGRRSSHYVWNQALVMFFIVSLTPLGAKMDASDTTRYADRLGHIMTLVLTAVAFKYVINERLPEVNYLTLMDKYILACFTFLAVLAFGAFVVAGVADGTFGGPADDEERVALARSIDRDIHYAWLACWAAVQVVVAVVATRTEAKKAPRQVELDHFVHPQNAAAMVQGKARSSSLATNANPMAQGSSAPSTGNVQAI